MHHDHRKELPSMSIRPSLPAARCLLIACVLATVAIVVSACGSSSTSSTTTSSAAAGSGTSTSASNKTYQARLNLARCYRAQGINVPDPTPGAGHAAGAGTQQILSQYPQAKVQAARQACRQYLAQANPQVNGSPATQAQFNKQFVQFAKCMRANGVPNFPDRIQEAEGAINPGDPAVQSALQACQRYAAGIEQGMGH
jgi:membrane-bound lytic murein transglycosylase